MFPKASVIRSTLSPKVKELVKLYPSVYKQPVQWGEQDSFRHVNNIWYLRYTETARFALLYQVLQNYLTPIQVKNYENGTGRGIILKSVNLQYKAPSNFPDTMILATRISKMEPTEFVQDTLIISEQQERVVCQSTSIVVGYDYDLGKKASFETEYHDCFASQLAKM